MGESVTRNSMVKYWKVPPCNYSSEKDDDCTIRVFKSDYNKVEQLRKKYKKSKVTQADVVNHFLETRKRYRILRKDLKHILESELK